MLATWLLQGSFLFESDGFRLLVDPYISDAVERGQRLTRLAPPPLAASELRPSAIYCTHDHMDHLDPIGLPEILSLNPGVRVAGPDSIRRRFEKLGLDSSRVDTWAIGSRRELGPFPLTVVKAFHSDPSATGFLLEAKGLLFYFSGDTLFSDDLPKLILDAAGGRAIDCAFVCINGRLGNMNAGEALQTVKAIHAAIAVPMHYGLFAENTVAPDAFVAACSEAGIRSLAFVSGVPTVINAGLIRTLQNTVP